MVVIWQNKNIHFLDTMLQQGDQITLTIKGKFDRQFRGFLIQALDCDENPIGKFTFTSAQRAECLKCGTNECGSITHKNSALKRRVVAAWGSPLDYVGKVQFKYSVVTSYDEFWASIDGPLVTVSK